MKSVNKFDLSAHDSARLVINTAVMARLNVPGLSVAGARREGVAGICIWIPGYVWRDGQIVTATEPDMFTPEGVQRNPDSGANALVVDSQDA